MANNQTSRDGACEKIFKAFRRISYPPKPATTSVLYSSGPTSSEVPIVFNHPPTQNTVTPMRKTNQVVRFASRNEPVKQLGHGEPKKKVVDRGSSAKVDNVDDMFSEYIDRVKAKIRTTSDVGGESGGYGYGSGGNGGGGGGGERSGLRPDSFNHRVNDYINRAKLKIRATSNVGARRSVSIK